MGKKLSVTDKMNKGNEEWLKGILRVECFSLDNLANALVQTTTKSDIEELICLLRNKIGE